MFLRRKMKHDASNSNTAKETKIGADPVAEVAAAQEALTAEFGAYLEKFQRDPTDAQEFLLGMHKGNRTDPNNAVKLVGYRPAVANGLPPDLQQNFQ